MMFNRLTDGEEELLSWALIRDHIRHAYAEIDRLNQVVSNREEAIRNIAEEREIAEKRLRELAGAVDPPPTWIPPMSLPCGKFTWSQSYLDNPRTGFIYYNPADHWSDWTAPPCVGIWEVTGPGKAVYRGPVK